MISSMNNVINLINMGEQMTEISLVLKDWTILKIIAKANRIYYQALILAIHTCTSHPLKLPHPQHYAAEYMIHTCTLL